MENFKIYALGLLATGIVFSTSCKKDEDNGDTPPTQSHYRVTEMISYENNIVDSKAEFTYNGEKLSVVTDYDILAKDQWELDSKTEINYHDNNTFEMVYFEYVNENWDIDDKDVVTHQNGIWQEYLEYFYDGADWVLEDKTEYTYNGDKIAKNESFYYVCGQAVNDEKIIYSWVGDAPSTAEYYEWQDEAWVANSKDTIYFSDGKISKVEMFSYDANDFVFKMEFQYTGDLVNKIEIWSKFMNTWTHEVSILFSYDENGNMTEQETTGEWGYRETYTYEKEKGNISLFFENTGWMGIPHIGKSGAKSNLSFNDIEKHFSTFMNK